jgi:Uma2 family endonuclease
MSTIAAAAPDAVDYPESDGLPMAENTEQFRWIVTIQGGLDNLFRDNADVFVAGDLLWYPVEGNNTICIAPDIMAAFGRPKGPRGSYLQWREDNVAPQVTFEVLSPGNRAGELAKKFQFYEHYGVEEYYVWNPDIRELNGWLRDNDTLHVIAEMHGWISPRLHVRFELVDGDLRLYGSDGERFVTYVGLAEQRDAERHAKNQAEQRAERLAAQLKSLGIEPEA